MIGVNVGVDVTLSSQSLGEPSVDRGSTGVSPSMGCSHFENMATGGGDWLVGLLKRNLVDSLPCGSLGECQDGN